LNKGLFELRERRYGFRVYYAFYRIKQIVLLAGGDKGTQKTDIKIAQERLAALLTIAKVSK
jgi:putative addiction module killer protein